MPAYFESGFSVRTPAWHGLGNVLADYPESVDDARVAAGLLWEPKLIPVYQRTLIPVGQALPQGAVIVDGQVSWKPDAADATAPAVGWAATPCDVMVEVENHQGVARDDTGAILGVPTKAFQPVFNHEMFAIAEALQSVPGARVKYETAGSLREGRTVYVLVYLDEPWTTGNDESACLPFLAITNHHDGSGAAKGIFTKVRIVCWNTEQAAEAEGERSGQVFTIRHTGSTTERIEAAKEAVQQLREQAKAWQVRDEFLASINVDDALVRTFFEEFIPTPDHASERLTASRAERREQLFRVYSESPTTDGIRGTAAGVFATAVEYLDHLRPYQNRDTYLARTMLGTSQSVQTKARALTTLRDLVGAS